MDADRRGAAATGTTPASERVAGHVSLDFVNTVSWDVDGLGDERLTRYRDLVRWAREAGLLTPDKSAALLEASEREPMRAEQALAQALVARRLIRDVFHAVALERAVPVLALDSLAAEAARAVGASRIVARDNGFIREWESAPSDLDQVIRPLLASAAELLLSERVALVRECANEHCGWLFLDESRNHLRRWCDMRVCGSRAKARRHYARQRQGLPRFHV
jgi:predicted RNA-binding Zn ribbon-like protein